MNPPTNTTPLEVAMAYKKRPTIVWEFVVNINDFEEGEAGWQDRVITVRRELTDREHPSHWAKAMARDGVRQDTTWFPGHRVMSVSWHREKELEQADRDEKHAGLGTRTG